MKQIVGGVTAAQGFSATGLAVGIKKKSEKKGMKKKNFVSNNVNR